MIRYFLAGLVSLGLLVAYSSPQDSISILTSIAYNKALAEGKDKQHILTVVDFTKPSTKKRLFIYDMNTGKLIFSTYVAHGSGSGGLYADSFSNVPDSHQSSIGVFETGETYYGHNGYSLKLHGLEPGINSNVYSRDIVVHGAVYIGNGRTGHSWGCFAVPMQDRTKVINLIKDGSIIIAYYPDQHWLNTSRYLNG